MHYNENFKILRGILSTVLSVLPALFWVLLIFSFDLAYIAVITVISAIIHELGHEIFLYKKFSKASFPRGVLHGLKISQYNSLSYKDEAWLYASGPLANAIAVISALPFCFLHPYYVSHFCFINLATCFSNLLPIEGYDGYGILRCIMSTRGNYESAYNALNTLSFSLTVAFCLISLYLIDRFGESYWIFAVFTGALIGKISERLKKYNNEK